MQQQDLSRFRLRSCPDFFFPNKLSSFKNAVLKMQHPDSSPITLDPASSRSPSPDRANVGDVTTFLSDELLLRIILSAGSCHFASLGLVSKRWLRIVDRLCRSLTLLDWSFLAGHSCRLTTRFQELTEVDLVPAAFRRSLSLSVVILTRGSYSLQVDPHSSHSSGDLPIIDSEEINRGLDVLARGCPFLQKLFTVAPLDSVEGLAAAALECHTLQELELHRCSDTALCPISAFKNLQILRLVASIDGLYSGPGVSDIGLTILAHGCNRLVKLELGGCEVSFDGISAIGRCCLMLEELTICDDRKMEGGWIEALPDYGNLKTLRLLSCRKIASLEDPMEHIRCCPTIERLLLQQCQIRNKKSLKAIFRVCECVKEIGFKCCWGLDDDMFSISSICRRVKFLSVERCSKITTAGLESVILSWNDLQSLTVVSCSSVRDSEVSPALSGLFSVLKEFRWRPNSKSIMQFHLQGTGMGKKGGKFFRRSRG